MTDLKFAFLHPAINRHATVYILIMAHVYGGKKTKI